MMDKAKENNNIPLASLGAGALAGHYGGVIGDFLAAGKLISYNIIEKTGNALGFENFQPDEGFFKYAGWAAGFYIGWKTMELTYNASRGLVNSLRNRFEKKEVEKNDFI